MTHPLTHCGALLMALTALTALSVAAADKSTYKVPVPVPKPDDDLVHLKRLGHVIYPDDCVYVATVPSAFGEDTGLPPTHPLVSNKLCRNRAVGKKQDEPVLGKYAVNEIKTPTHYGQSAKAAGNSEEASGKGSIADIGIFSAPTDISSAGSKDAAYGIKGSAASGKASRVGNKGSGSGIESWPMDGKGRAARARAAKTAGSKDPEYGIKGSTVSSKGYISDIKGSTVSGKVSRVGSKGYRSGSKGSRVGGTASLGRAGSAVRRAPPRPPRRRASTPVRFVRTPCQFVKGRKCCRVTTLGSHPCSCFKHDGNCFEIKRVISIIPFESVRPPCPKCYDLCSHDRRICCRLWPCK